MSTEANQAMIRQMGEAFNTRDLRFLDHCFSPHFFLHTAVTPGWPQGLEGARQMFTTMLTTAPDIRVTIEDLVAEGEKVAVRWTFRGTHTGESPAHGPPTGKPFTAVGMAIDRFTEGKIEEDWGVEALWQTGDVWE